jgi:hypothetical protein
VICQFDNPKRSVALKYRNIDVNKKATLDRFIVFTKSFDGAHHVNFYGGITGDFKQQIKLT